jgi:hypothetical protein
MQVICKGGPGLKQRQIGGKLFFGANALGKAVHISEPMTENEAKGFMATPAFFDLHMGTEIPVPMEIREDHDRWQRQQEADAAAAANQIKATATVNAEAVSDLHKRMRVVMERLNALEDRCTRQEGEINELRTRVLVSSGADPAAAKTPPAVSNGAGAQPPAPQF